MPVEVGIWRLGPKLQRLPMSSIESEMKLEEALAGDITTLSPSLLLLGRQVQTEFGKFIDLLAMDATGRVSVIELKKEKTPREVVAQLLDYASWVQSLSYKDIADIFSKYNGGKKLEEGFADAFGSSPPEAINESHELIVVSSELDPSTERILGYLAVNYGVPINAVFFRYFRDEDREYLARTWLIDPEEAESKSVRAAAQKSLEPWNGSDFYVSLGEDENRSWEDCRRYGFISGGGGKWYTQTLDSLFPGSRIFVNIPKKGYVGVGIVKETAVPVADFKVAVDAQEVPILEAPLAATKMGENSDNPELRECLVRVEWIKTLPRSQAFWEKGFFASQHTACKLRNRFTRERLVELFALEE